MNPASLTALRDAFQRCRDMNASLKERLDNYSLAVRQVVRGRVRPVSVMLCRHLSYQTRMGVWSVSNS